ncbi:hypothetical protein JCM3766R1_004861 [Sporobolomyces carnicolor]
MLLLTASVYIVITIPSIRTIALDPSNPAQVVLPGLDAFTRFQNVFVKHSTGTLAERARETAKLVSELGPMTWDERVMHVQVLCAGNVIAAGLLVGVVLLQASEWYLEEELRKEEIEQLRNQLAPSTTTTTKTGPVTEEKKKQ